MVGKKIKIFVLIFVLFVTGCEKERKQTFHPRYIRDASFILQINDQNFFEDHPDYLSSKVFKESGRQFFRKLNISVPAVFHFFVSGQDSKMAALLHPGDSVRFERGDSSVYQGQTYFYREKSGEKMFYSFFPEYVLVTDNKILMEKLIRQLPGTFIRSEKSELLSKFVNPEASGHWFVFPKNIHDKEWYVTNHSFLFKNTGDVHIWDLENPSDYRYEGVGFSMDSVRNMSEVFFSVSSFPSFPAFLLPKNVEEFIHLNFDSFPLFYRAWIDYKTFAGYSNHPVEMKKIKSLKSITQTGEKNGFLFAYFSSEPEGLDKKLKMIERNESYEIFLSPDSLLFSKIFYPLIKKISYPYVFKTENYWIWSRDLKKLKHLIKHIEQDYVFQSGDFYEQIFSKTPENFKVAVKSGQTLYTLSDAEEVLYETFYVNATDKHVRQSDRSKKNEWKKISTIKTGEFIILPKWIYNHRSGKFEIVYQDKQLNLVLTDAKGKIRWKKNIADTITSSIYQVDMFKNGKRQFVFSTSNGIYVVDILGNFVKPFPLNKKITSPLAVFDYDKNKNYRLMFSEGKQVVVYDLKGRPVKGFKPVVLSSPLQFAPQHLRIKNKDYIFLQQEDGILKIVNRKGEPRIRLDQKVQVKIPWQVYKNKFVSVSQNGKLVFIDTKGNISYDATVPDIKTAAFSSKHVVIITEKGFVYIDNKKIDLPLSAYHSPKIYFYEKKPLFVLLDSDTKQIVLIDSQGVLETVPGDRFSELLFRKNARYLLTGYAPEEIEVYYKND